jgi:LTXXQ motif family protein
MRSSFRIFLTPLAASVFAVAVAAVAVAQSDNPPPMQHGMQHWGADHEALLNAKLAGLKAGLGLNPDQEKLWAPFEAAVREAAEMHMKHMMGRMERMHGMGESDMGPDMGRGMMTPDMGEDEDQRASPVDRLEAMADRLSEAAAALKKVADTAKPLYASLDDTQKRIFVVLGREMMMLGHGHGGMMGWDHGDQGARGPHHQWGEGPDDEE